MKTSHLIFTLAACTAWSVAPVFAQGYVHVLPLKVENKDQLFTSAQSGTGQFHVRSTNNFAFIKPGSSWNTGWSEAVICFQDIPGFLNIHATSIRSSACTSGTHNPVKISESTDGVNYTQIQQISSDQTHDLQIGLKKDTRYIKLYYNVPANGAFNKSYCSHGFEPMTVSLPKSVDIQGEQRNIQGKVGELLKDTISVDYSNPVGDLLLTSTNEQFTFRKLSEEAEAGAAGTAQFEISYEAQAAGDFTTTLKVSDAAYAEAFEEIELSASIIAKSAPEAPANLSVTSAGYTGATIEWDAIADAASYIVILFDAEEVKLNEFTTSTNSITLEDLTPETAYSVAVKSVNAAAVESELSGLLTVTTAQIPAPTDLKARADRFTITCEWSAPAGVHNQHIKLYDAAAVLVKEEILEADATSHTFGGLTRGNLYTASLHATVEGGHTSRILSAEATTAKDFGTQLQNSGFDFWENASKGQEPNNWNSFASATGSAAFLAKSEQVQKSDDRRPGTDGTYSANLFSKTIVGVTANGNLTTGRIYANSTTATDLSNYNAIVANDPEFHQVVEERPDSVSIWVKFAAGSPTSDKAIARMSFILHADGVVNEPSASVSALIAAHAVYEWSPCEWTRVSFPFATISDQAPKFMLASITTNKTPGVGSGGTDNLFVDDLVLVYKPQLNVEPITASNLQEGDELIVPYTLSGTMSVSNLNAPANTVYAELSDHTGSFSNPTRVCEPVTTDESGELTVTLPAKMVSGNNYRIRVVTTNYPMTAVSEQDLQVDGSDIPSSLESQQEAASRLYPNPAKERIYITHANGAAYQIRNIANQTVVSAIYHDGGIDVSGLNSGVYVIDITRGSSVEKLKFIKE